MHNTTPNANILETSCQVILCRLCHDKMDPPKLGPPGTNLPMDMYPLELLLQNLDHPLELILLRNKDPWNLFHCNIWTPSNNNYMYGAPL